MGKIRKFLAIFYELNVTRLLWILVLSLATAGCSQKQQLKSEVFVFPLLAECEHELSEQFATSTFFKSHDEARITKFDEVIPSHSNIRGYVSLKGVKPDLSTEFLRGIANTLLMSCYPYSKMVVKLSGQDSELKKVVNLYKDLGVERPYIRVAEDGDSLELHVNQRFLQSLRSE